MTSRRRLVRFRDLLPASVVQRASGAIDDEPLFSPTIEQPKLLHSIFSPTNENGVENQGNRDREGLSFLSPLFKMQPRQHSTQNSHTALRPVINQCDRTTEDLNSANGAKVTAYGEQTMAPTTPLRKNSEPCLYSSVVKNPGRLQQRSPSIPDVTSIYISPTHTALSSLAVSMDADLFSPLSTKTVRDVDLSKNSVKSAHSTTTTFQMLEKTGCFTFEHITTCKSVSTLVRIISVLESSFCEPKYPSLLRAAHKRLLALHGLPENSSDSRISPNTVMASDLFSSALPADSNCHNNTTQTSSSLIMSISTDRDDESHYTSPPTNISPPSQAPSATELSASRFHPTATDRGFSETELHLWKQVQRLTQTIAEMEQTGADDFYHRLLLQNQDEPKEVETLEEHVDNKELLRSVEQLRERNHKLQEQIQLETAAREQKLMQSAAIEERLSVELKQLQNQLAETAQASTATETHLQRQHERLQQLLFTTQANLRRIQSDREALIQCMLQAVGRNNHNEKINTQAIDRDRLLAEFEHRNAARQSAVERMTEDVIESARLRQNAEDAQRKCEGLLIDATRGRRLLERENLALMEEIKHLTEKLSATRAQMEELLHSAQLEQRAAWEERERKYKHIISDMKEHIRKQENVVPVSLYRTAVAEAKQHAVVSKNHKDMAASWKNKVVELQQVIRARNFAEIGAAQIWDTAEMNCSPPSLLRSKRNHVTFAVDEYRPNLPLPIEASHASSSHGAVSATPAVANRSPVEPPASQSLTMKPFTAKMNGTAASSMTATPVKTPRMKPTGSSATTTRAFENGKIPTQMALSLNLTTPFSNASRTPVVLPLRHTTPAGSKTPSRLEFTCSPVLEGGLDRSRIRASMVRAAGGRMGMQKKLREMRSPLPKQLSSEVGLEKYQKKLEQMQIRPRPLKEKN